jgi:hypothetical protein
VSTTVCNVESVVEDVGKEGTCKKERSILHDGNVNPTSKGKSVDKEGCDDPDRRKDLIIYLLNPECTTGRKLHTHALKYTLVGDELYRWMVDGLLLKCLDKEQAKVAMGEVHEGLCGTHQSAPKMKWMLRRAVRYCAMMMDDCVRYKKGCEACQKFGDVQLTPASILHPIVKPWPFRRWGLDFVGDIHPVSSKGHRFVLVATDYFTKWTEAVPLKNMTHKKVMEFVQEHIIHRFGIPQTLTTDQGASFMSW